MSSDIDHMPLYRKVAAELQSQFGRRYMVGDALPRDKDLAKEFGVSLITIRGAMNLLRAEGYISSGRGRSTTVRQTSRVGPVAILIALDYEHPRSSPFYRHAIATIKAELEERGMSYREYKGNLEPAAPQDVLSVPDFEDDLKAGLIGGVISLGTDPELPWYRKARQAGIPVLGSHRDFKDALIPNTFGVVDVGLLKMVEAGCQRIAVLGWDGYRKDNWFIRDYFYKALNGYGIVGYEHWFKFDLHPLSPGSAWEMFREIWTSRREKPDGVFILDGEMLPGVCLAMNDLGLKAPDDIFVVSTTVNAPEVELFDGILHLCCDPEEVGREIVDTYCELVKGHFKGCRFVPYRMLTPSGETRNASELKRKGAERC